MYYNSRPQDRLSVAGPSGKSGPPPHHHPLAPAPDPSTSRLRPSYSTRYQLTLDHLSRTHFFLFENWLLWTFEAKKKFSLRSRSPSPEVYPMGTAADMSGSVSSQDVARPSGTYSRRSSFQSRRYDLKHFGRKKTFTISMFTYFFRYLFTHLFIHIHRNFSFFCIFHLLPIDGLIDWLVDWLIGWLIRWLIGWLVDWLVGWLIDWLIDWLFDWLIDWSTFFYCISRQSHQATVYYENGDISGQEDDHNVSVDLVEDSRPLDRRYSNHNHFGGSEDRDGRRQETVSSEPSYPGSFERNDHYGVQQQDTVESSFSQHDHLQYVTKTTCSGLGPNVAIQIYGKKS